MNSDQKKSLIKYLKNRLVCTGELTLTALTGGVSNLTYRLSDGEQQWIVRTSPSGTKAKGAHDMVREYNLLKSLSEYYVLSPKVYFLIDDLDIFPRPVYVMEAIEGIEIHRSLPDVYQKQDQAMLCRALIKAQLQLHQVPLTDTLQNFNMGRGYIERQISGWIKRYKNVQPNHNRADMLIHWLQKNLPADNKPYALIHNDFKFDNLIFDTQNPTQIIGVLDWEMATVGDPLMDLGCSLAYWIQANDHPSTQAIRTQPTTENGMLTRDEYVHEYCRLSGIQLDNYDFYYVYGLFRLTVIVQQIYYRYQQGQTNDQRFKPFGDIHDILINHSLQQIGDINV